MTTSNRQTALQRLAQLGFTGNVDDMNGVEYFLWEIAYTRFQQTNLDAWHGIWTKTARITLFPGHYYWQVAQTTEDFLKLDYWYETNIQDWG